ncbi:hypothetical protein VFPFJ_01590 [Purpureocillium lilacinum]|uniref:Uncharacterized protein n=1 Tax=Purpureocillium lilacinum TaxID=33203 RepID=A0A179I1G9_PURLI|nr:hypothetical protein VFPFJ_01590 [Purpureocillium lilacinum]OAQ87519.1 hypothetical protein VFPBJ_01559 [Purpureocillium lilacinum]OAQ95480.1 hypothetical protein VFPFJ_01590 [Purpureocillium lilacinum]
MLREESLFETYVPWKLSWRRFGAVGERVSCLAVDDAGRRGYAVYSLMHQREGYQGRRLGRLASGRRGRRTGRKRTAMTESRRNTAGSGQRQRVLRQRTDEDELVWIRHHGTPGT